VKVELVYCASAALFTARSAEAAATGPTQAAALQALVAALRVGDAWSRPWAY
jgi:hypothetical protein